MQGFNAWVSMDQAFKGELWQFVRNGTLAVTFPDINNISPETVAFFNGIYDEGAVEKLFKGWDAAGRNYKLWSFYSDKPTGTQIIKGDLDMLMVSYPQDFSMMGAWYSAGDGPIYDNGGQVDPGNSREPERGEWQYGREVGTSWDYTDPQNPVLTGVPWYPQPPQLINFMPDKLLGFNDPPDNTDPIYGPATEVTDVNLLFGQSPRTLQ